MSLAAPISEPVFALSDSCSSKRFVGVPGSGALRFVRYPLTDPPRSSCGAESSLTQPQMVVMSDTDDPFVPLPDDLLVNLAESRAVVESLLDSLPTTFSGNAQVGSEQAFEHPMIIETCVHVHSLHIRLNSRCVAGVLPAFYKSHGIDA